MQLNFCVFKVALYNEGLLFSFFKKGVLQMMQTRINSLKASVERYFLLKFNKNTKIIIIDKNSLQGILYY